MQILLFSFAFLIIISIFFKRENLKYYFLIVSLVLAVLAFLYVPNSKMDLYRHYTMLDMTRIYGFDYIMTSDDYKSLPVIGIYMYLISLLNCNSFLPGITAFIVYKLSLDIVYLSGIKYNSSKSGMLLAAYFYIGTANYLGTISGIRNPLAITIFIYLLYIELIEKKHIKLCWIGYLMTCLIHVSMVLPLVLRISVYLYKRFTKTIIKVALICWSVFLPIIMNILSSLSGIPLIGLLVTKMNSYDSEEANAVANVSLYTAVYSTIVIVTIIVFIYYGVRVIKVEKGIDKDFFNFCVLITCYVIGSINSYHVFVRMTRVLVLLSIPIITYLNKKEILIYKKGYINIREIIFLIILMESTIFMAFLFHGQYMFYTIS